MDSPRNMSEPIDLVLIDPTPPQPITSSPQMQSPLSSSALVTISTVARVLGKRINEAEECLLQNGSIHETMVQLYSNVYGDVILGQVPDKMIMPTMAFMKIEPEEIQCEPLLPETMLSIEKMVSEEMPFKSIPNEQIRSETLPSTETMPSDPKPSTKAMSPNPAMHSKSPQAKKKFCNRNAMQPSTRVLRPNPSKTIKRSNAPQAKKNIICRKKQATMLSTLVPQELPSEPMPSTVSTPEAIQSNSNIHPNAPSQPNQNNYPIKHPTNSSTVIFWRPWDPMSTNAPPNKNIICQKKNLRQATMPPTVSNTVVIRRMANGQEVAQRMMVPECIDLTEEEGQHEIGSFWKPIGEQIPLQALSNKGPMVQHQTSRPVSSKTKHHHCMWSGCAFKSNHKGNAAKHVRHKHLGLRDTLMKMKQNGIVHESENWAKWIRSTKSFD